MSFFIHTEADLDAAIAGLVAADPRFGDGARRAPGGRRCGGARTALPGSPRSWSRSSSRPPAPRRSGDGSPRRSIRSITPRCCARGRRRLARAGLSAPKIRTLKAIAKAIDRGHIDLAALVDKSADEAHAALTALHGIGPWTADIYLLFCLGHADAWPAGDLALQEAAQLLLALRTRPTTQGHGAAGRGVAAVARRRGLHAVGLLSRAQAARGRADRSQRQPMRR